MTPSLTHAQITALAGFGTSAVSNAIETFRVRMRNEGYIANPIKRQIALPQSMVGYALTVRMRTGSPPANGNRYAEGTDWWSSLASAPRPSVLVIEDVDETPGVGSVSGEIHGTIFRAFGVIGIVTNGAVRDIDALARMKMHAYARSLSPSHAYAHVIDVGTEIEIAGTAIRSGDLLHGDQHGIVIVPTQIAADIPRVVEDMVARERKIISLCAQSHFDIDELRDLIAAFTHDDTKGS